MSISLVRNLLLTTTRRRRGAIATFGVLVTMLAAGDASAQSAEREAAQSVERDAAAAASAPTRTAYQAYLAADCVPGSNFCKFASENMPARSVLEIQKVSCQGWHDGTDPNFVVIGELRTGADAFVGRIHFFRTTYETGSTGLVWTIADEALIFIPATHKFRINLNSGTTGVGSYGCTISGFLTIS